MQALHFALIGQQVVWVIWVRKHLLHIVLWCSAIGGCPAGTGSAVVLVLLLLVVLHYLRQPETLLKEVDEGLAQVLLCPVAVQEVSLVGVNLWTNTRKWVYTEQRLLIFEMKIKVNK